MEPDAARNGREVLDMFVDLARTEGRTLPEPRAVVRG
jgi:predicted RNase H-like HicB family nuclease